MLLFSFPRSVVAWVVCLALVDRAWLHRLFSRNNGLQNGRLADYLKQLFILCQWTEEEKMSMGVRALFWL